MSLDWVRWDENVQVGMDHEHFFVGYANTEDSHMVYWGLWHILIPIFFVGSRWWHWRLTFSSARRLAVRLACEPPPRPSAKERAHSALVEATKREFAAHA